MPSEKPSADLLLRTLHRPLDAFRSALTATIEQIRSQATAGDDVAAP